MSAVAALLIAAGCGGGNSTATTGATASSRTTTRSQGPSDPGRDAIEAFVAAARRDDAAASWRMLSTPSRDRLGPTLAAFRRDEAAGLHKRFAPFRAFEVIVSERITPELGIVAIDDGRRVDAVVLRLEGETWKVELGGPVRIQLIGQPLLAQVAVSVEGPGGAGTAVMYVDGQTVIPKVYSSPTNSTVFANLEPPLDPGRHTLVVFASNGRDASAGAWAFTAKQ